MGPEAYYTAPLFSVLVLLAVLIGAMGGVMYLTLKLGFTPLTHRMARQVYGGSGTHSGQ